MADPALRRRANIEGPLYVDQTCIDCDTCRWMAPEIYHESGGKSAVHHQPDSPESLQRALHALISCPTASIGYTGTANWQKIQSDFPLPITPNVWHCGYHPRASFGATSYLLATPNGNVLIDSPRFAGPLVRQLETMGGVDWLLLTHRDDVADHARFAKHFGCNRVIHEADADAAPGAETILTGTDPATILPGLTAHPVPGHTRGHVVYHWAEADEPVLFTGDHLAWSDQAGRLTAFRGACWYDWSEQTRSMRRLLELPFSWVLPGHGRRAHLPIDVMQNSLKACIAWMEQV